MMLIYKPSEIVTFLLLMCVCSFLAAASINSVTENTDPVQLYEKFEITIDLTADYTNPFNPDEVDLWAEFDSPTAVNWNRINGFWDGTDWKIRFAANETGTWSYTVYLDDGLGQISSGPYNFSVKNSEHHGWIRVSDTDAHYLEYSNDSSFYGVGQSRAWDLPSVPNIYTDMKDHKMNMLHYWLPSWDNILVTDETGYDQYDMTHAANIDDVVNNCETNGIALVFTIWNHDELRGAGHPWPRHYFDEYNPFRELSSADGFFSDETSWGYQQKLYRYIIARWGYSRAIGLWQTICEIDGTSNSYNNDVVTDPWHVEINNYFKQNDPFNHPTTASKSSSPWNWSNGFSVMDVIQVHTYENNSVDIASTIASRTQTLFNTYNKPVFHGEFGDDGNSNNQQPEHLHNGIWAGFCTGGAITPLDWNDGGSWADFNSEMYDHAKYLSQFAECLRIDTRSLAQASLSVPGEFNGYGLIGSELGIVWIQDKSPGELNSSVSVSINVQSEGKYALDWYNTWTGEYYSEKNIVTSSTLTISTTAPDFEKDIACRLTKVGSLSDKTMYLDAVGDVTTWPETDYRWKDIEDNLYTDDYQNSFTYAQPRVILSFAPNDTLFRGTITAYSLKPNFAYQIKLVGKPEKDWGDDGDDLSNELIGFEGRWWRKQPNPNNSDDSDYLANKDNPDYIFEGYLLFDYFATDEYGYVRKQFEADNSFHVLWNTVINSRSPGANDSPVTYHCVRAAIQNDIYTNSLDPDDVGLYAEWEPGRDLPGEAGLPGSDYSVRLLLTEESFHQSGLGGYWAAAMGNDTLNFTIIPKTYSDTESATTGSAMQFNDRESDGGDGRKVEIDLSILDGSGLITVTQINAHEDSIPCCNAFNYRLCVSKDEGINNCNGDVTFHYKESDILEYPENNSYLGIAQYNSVTKTWAWLGGQINASSNTITVTGINPLSTFKIFGRRFGDVDGDGDVDSDDMVRFEAVWHSTNSNEFSRETDEQFFNYNRTPDQSNNQFIDGADLQVFGDNWD